MFIFYSIWVLCFIMIAIGYLFGIAELIQVGMVGLIVCYSADLILSRIDELKEE